MSDKPTGVVSKAYHNAEIERLQAQLKSLRSLQLCGHPLACIVSTNEGTAHCAWCENVAFYIQDGERRFQEEHALRKKAESEVERLTPQSAIVPPPDELLRL